MAIAVDYGPKVKVKAPTTCEYNEIGTAVTGLNVAEDSRRGNASGTESLKPRPTAGEKSSFRSLAARRSIYRGSYGHPSPRASIDANASGTPHYPSPRASTSHLLLEPLLQAVDRELETYGVEELRDGFFDAAFYRPLKRNHEDLMRKASSTLPETLRYQESPLSFRRFLPQQLREAKSFFHQVYATRAGIKLLKSFCGIFIAYIVCLIPTSRDWLGRYNYIIVISAIINHPGRTIGSQLDGTILTIVGTFLGLAWGSFALYVSTSTPTAQSGYGGVLAAFLVVFATLIGWLRAVFVRFYQAVLCAGVAICYACLANTSQNVSWVKVFDYGIPWVLGQAVCLLVCILVAPDAGSDSLALALHESLQTIQEGLNLPHEDSSYLKQKLAEQFVNLSQAVRDFTIDISFSKFVPDDVRSIRNLIQALERSILAIRPNTALFDVPNTAGTKSARPGNLDVATSSSIALNEPIAYLICSSLREPTRSLLDAMLEAVKHADKACSKIGAQDVAEEPGKLSVSLGRLKVAQEAFDSADAELLADPTLPSLYHKSPDVLELFLFIHPVRQASDKVHRLIAKVLEMQSTNTRRRIRFPSYPPHKAIMRTNAQVRHDRGGLTAGFYFRSKRQLDRTLADLQSTAYSPTGRDQDKGIDTTRKFAFGEYQNEQEMGFGKHPDVPKMARFRFQLWEVLHRLQGFESRFAFKVTLVTTLLSIPAWLPQSHGWWNENDSWWAVVAVWMMMHARVGGTFQDLAVRSFCAALGATWGGIAYAAGEGNPYVMAVFAMIFITPMLHRYTQSSHPRSGIIGCLSFTVVSLSSYTKGGSSSTVKIAWTRGLAFVIGVVAAMVANWILWPFVARHELRKSLSTMVLHSAILYRGVVAKYMYYAKDEEPGPQDVIRSEMLEGRLREGFVRMRQLMELTRHEMRLRAPFNPLPYSALIAACESFFEHLIQLRQSSLYFQPSMLASDPSTVASLTAPRRDAVAVILLNLYVLSSALRADQPVPRYLPSAAAARRKLLDRMEIVEAEQTRIVGGEGKGKSVEHSEGRRWADVYQYAFSSSLTEIVEALQELQRYTKEICGEVVWDSDVLEE